MRRATIERLKALERRKNSADSPPQEDYSTRSYRKLEFTIDEEKRSIDVIASTPTEDA